MNKANVDELGDYFKKFARNRINKPIVQKIVY